MPHKYMRDQPGAIEKWCRHCEQTLPIALFNVSRDKPDGRSIYCRPCANRPKKKQERRDSLLRFRANRRALLAELKQRPCMDCGGTFPPVCMQYDHRDPETKQRKVSDFGRGGTMQDFLAEIEKCDLVCANCHAIRTERRRLERLGQTS